SDARARGRSDEGAALGRALVRIALWFTVVLGAIMLAGIAPVAELLQIDSVAPVAVAVLVVLPSALYVGMLGALQGRQEFGELAVALALPFVGRLVLFGVLAGIGWRLYGALAATVLAGLAGVALAAWWSRELFRPDLRPAPWTVVGPFLRKLLPIAVA